ncbi:DUF6177 family protein [Leucobacter sp. HNU]|uniref:DUF6177 family protein n=1 Tax=Leucobacter sp. HNU TaxID=3236805 RepID=UPI003A7F8EB0
MTQFEHPLLDFGEGPYACTESFAATIHFSEPLADFLTAAHGAGLTPVVIARADAWWSFAARFYCEAFGARRLVWVSGGFMDLDSGARGGTVSEACAGPGEPWTGEWPSEPDALQAVVMASAHHSASVEVEIGSFAEILAEGLAGCGISAWGAHEPAPLVWEKRRYTEYLRSQMPTIRTFLSGGGGVFQGVHSVSRTPTGVMEVVTATMPVAPIGTPFPQVASTATDVLSRVADSVSMPMIGSVCVMPGWRSGAYPSAPTPAIVPAAVLIGPRAVRALGVDLEALATEHRISAAGRRRLPSVIAGFDGVSGTPWQQAKSLAEAFGESAIVGALDGGGR